MTVTPYTGPVSSDYDEGNFYAVRWNLYDEPEGLRVVRVRRRFPWHYQLRSRKIGNFCFATPDEAEAAAGRMLATGSYRANIRGVQWLGE